MQPNQWQLHKAVRCAALADAPYAFSSTLENALQRSDEAWAVLTKQYATHPQQITFFAFEGANACGMSGCGIDAANANEAEMFAVWVAATHRHQGVGRALIDFASQWAQAHGAKLLKVGVFADNVGAVKFYLAHGFQDTGRTKPELSDAERTVLLLVKQE